MSSTAATTSLSLAKSFRTIAKSRHSCKRFQPGKLIPNDQLEDILQTSLTSPSGFNIQPTQVIIVQNAKIKTDVSSKAMLGPGNKYRTNDASVVAVFLSDLQIHKRIPKIIELERKCNTRDAGYMSILPIASSFTINEDTSSSGASLSTMFKKVATQVVSKTQPMPTIEHVQSWSYKNTSLLAQTFVLGCTSYGLSTCIMEGFDAGRLKDVLNIPDRYAIPLTVAVGYDYDDHNGGGVDRVITPRLELEDVVFKDTFGVPLQLENSQSTV